MQVSAALIALSLAVSGAMAVPTKAASSQGIEIPMERRAIKSAIKGNKGQVNWDAVQAEVAYLKAKYAKSLANYQRNTGKAHALDARSTLEKKSTGTVALTDVSNELLWTGTMAFGTSAQSFAIDFDTGSSDTLVGPEYYNPSSSSTSQDTGTTFQDSYGDGTTASGEVYQDVLTIGGLKANTAYIGLSQQDFVSQGAGIAGMAFPALSSFQQQEPFFYSLINAGVLSQESFVFKIRNGGGSLSLGTADSAASYTPVTQAAYWSVNGKINSQSISGIIDSGTTLIVAPTTEAETLFKSLGLKYTTSQGQTTATYNCNSPPSVSLTFGGKTINLGAATAYGTDSNGNCVLSVIGADVGSAGWICGDPLFQEATITFDVANQRVGFSSA